MQDDLSEILIDAGCTILGLGFLILLWFIL